MRLVSKYPIKAVRNKTLFELYGEFGLRGDIIISNSTAYITRSLPKNTVLGYMMPSAKHANNYERVPTSYLTGCVCLRYIKSGEVLYSQPGLHWSFFMSFTKDRSEANCIIQDDTSILLINDCTIGGKRKQIELVCLYGPFDIVTSNGGITPSKLQSIDYSRKDVHAVMTISNNSEEKLVEQAMNDALKQKRQEELEKKQAELKEQREIEELFESLPDIDFSDLMNMPEFPADPLLTSNKTVEETLADLDLPEDYSSPVDDYESIMSMR